jgi:hypothetical protein
MKSILDPTFDYTPSAQTDVRKTFARVWRQIRATERLQGSSAFGLNTESAERDRKPADPAPVDAVDTVVIRESVPGMSLVTFVGSRLTSRSRRSD